MAKKPINAGATSHISHRDQAAVHDRDGHGILEYLTRAVALARAGILRRECADGGTHGTRHDEQEADHLLDQAHGGGVDQAAVVGDDGDKHKRHLDAAVLHGHGHADLKNAADAPRAGGAGRCA